MHVKWRRTAYVYSHVVAECAAVDRSLEVGDGLRQPECVVMKVVGVSKQFAP